MNDNFGAIPLSADVLGKANIGLWAFELDEGHPPRMYVNDAMLGLIGLDCQVSPEETYHAWYDHIDEGSYGLVADAVEKMGAGEYAEVQYPWHHPDGRTMIVRCGGTRNPGYTKGIRIEGTHQDVSQVLHFQQEAVKRYEGYEKILSSEYQVVYFVDMAEGKSVMVTGDEEAKKFMPIFNTDSSSALFANFCRFYVDAVIEEEDREKVKSVMNEDNMRKVFRTGNSMSVNYRVRRNLVDPVYMEMRMLKAGETDGEVTAVILAFKLTDDDVRNTIALTEKIEEQNAQLEETLTFTNYFLGSYVSAYYVNLNTHECQVYKRADGTRDGSMVIEDYYSSLSNTFSVKVHPDDRKELIETIHPDSIRKILKERPDYVHIFRDIASGEERVFRMHVIRGADENHAAFGFQDITIEHNKQQERFLGAVPLSPDILNKADIGLWSFEMDEGKPPRMYGDEAMLRLVGLDHQVTPEKMYHAWYDHIDQGSYGLVADAVDKMMTGHAEVQYPWHHPDGHTMIVRCGGVRNYEYTKGIRIEGTHQNVTEVLHYDEKEAERLRNAEIQLKHEQLRSEVLNYMVDNDDDPIELLKNYAERIRVLINCDQVIYRDLEETRIMVNSPAIEKTWSVPIEFCRQCEHFDAHHPMYKDGYTEMDNCQEGWQGIPVYHECPIKSSLTRIVYCDGEIAGYLAIHYVQDYHHFTDTERATLEEFTRILSISLSRYASRQRSKALEEEERKYAIQRENELVKSHFRADALAFVTNREPDLDEVTEFFGKRIIEISGCDQVIYRETDGTQRVFNREGINDIPYGICHECPFSKADSGVFENGTVIMNDCTKGCRGVMAHPSCPAKSSLMQQVYSGGELKGVLTVHYLNGIHEFTDNGIDIMKTVAIYLGLAIGRIEARKADKARLEAESANKAKTEFLFNMSHDIRTPMNAIIGFTNIARKHIDDREKVANCLDKTEKSGELLLSLINSILDMSRIESGNAVIEENAGDVMLSFANIEDTMEQLAGAKDIDLTFEFGNIKDRYIYCDFNQVTRVFVNIITNAIKYTHEGGFVKVKCDQIESTREGYGNYRYTFSDNGIGMSEEFQQHVFEQFAREKTATNSGVQGTGLGLALCKSFVELMGGTITCESEQGRGTVFTVILPFRLQEGRQYTDPHTGEVLEAGDEDHIRRDIFRGKKVLLVEDNELNREIATDILEDEGMIVEEAEDGGEAVKMMKKNGPDYYDFVLMDIQMPVMNGYEATKAIREMYPGAKLPIIALSANAFAEDKAKSLAAGMNDHIAKPVEIKNLFASLSKYL